MGTPLFTPEFKEEADRQITERGYSVAEVFDRLGVSALSLYKWLRVQLKRTEEERDILKRPRGTLQGSPTKVPLYQ